MHIMAWVEDGVRVWLGNISEWAVRVADYHSRALSKKDLEDQ